MNQITIIEDTRNQANKHSQKNLHFSEKGINVVRSKLFVGDYTKLNDMSICIDTKKDILEVASNLCSKEHERFRNECIKAQENGIKLIVLIEENFYDMDNLQNWISPVRTSGKFKGQPYSKVNGDTLKKIMLTMQEKYGVEFQFCKPHFAGETILELLKVEV